MANDKGINISSENSADKGIVWGDRVQLRRVIMNLLSNSIKYAYQNTDLKIYVYNENKYTCFKFENKSPYLTTDRQEKIFSKYVSYSKTNNGTGLGLYASKKIVEAHGGEIFVKSFEDERNIFGFKIPNDDSMKNKSLSVTF